jgi:hypothetical protein
MYNRFPSAFSGNSVRKMPPPLLALPGLKGISTIRTKQTTGPTDTFGQLLDMPQLPILGSTPSNFDVCHLKPSL